MKSMKILAMNADENQWRFWIKINYEIHEDISEADENNEESE